MTRKETLLARKYELQNELRILRGEEPYNLAERTSDWKFRQTAKEEREYTLKADIERLAALIAQQKVDNERNAKTAAYKAQLENEKEIQIGAYNEYSNNTLEVMKSWIKDFLGEHWTVKFMSDNCIDFAVWNAETGKFAFGQEINVRAEKHDYLNSSKELFETNIGSTGSFGLTEQEVGDTIRITKLDDPYDHSYVGREGVVEFIDSADQIHGSWGGLALIPGEDDFIVIGRAAS